MLLISPTLFKIKLSYNKANIFIKLTKTNFKIWARNRLFLYGNNIKTKH